LGFRRFFERPRCSPTSIITAYSVGRYDQNDCDG
jgi:hypothetical protein